MSKAAASWEYKDYVYNWERGVMGARISGNDSYTLAGARLEFWSASKLEIEREIQKWLDDGWEIIGEVGPSNIETREYKSVTKGKTVFGIIVMIILTWPTVGLIWLAQINHFSEPTVLRVQMRRPKA